MKGTLMGYSGSGYADTVALALIEAGVDTDTKIIVLKPLLSALQADDWDQERETLESFSHDPGIVAAFEAAGIDTTCGHYDADLEATCAHQIGHEGKHGIDWE